MSIFYDLYENPEIKENKGEKRLHARVVPSGTICTKEFIERISMHHHLPQAQLIGALEAMTEELRTLLSTGYSVEFGNLGYFTISLSINRPITNKKEVRSPSISLKNIHLKTKKEYKNKLNLQMELERVPTPAYSTTPLSLEECKQKLTNFLSEHPCINRADYSRLTGTNKIQAIRQLNLFIEEGIIQKYGKGKSVVYIYSK